MAELSADTKRYVDSLINIGGDWPARWVDGKDY